MTEREEFIALIKARPELAEAIKAILTATKTELEQED